MADRRKRTPTTVNRETIKAPKAFELPDGTKVKKGQTIVVYPKRKESDE